MAHATATIMSLPKPHVQPNRPLLVKTSHSSKPSGKSVDFAALLRSRRASLRASLQQGSLSLFTVRRAGASWAIPCACPFCDEAPPSWMHQTYLRRRWQVSHLALRIKRGVCNRPDIEFAEEE